MKLAFFKLINLKAFRTNILHLFAPNGMVREKRKVKFDTVLGSIDSLGVGKLSSFSKDLRTIAGHWQNYCMEDISNKDIYDPATLDQTNRALREALTRLVQLYTYLYEISETACNIVFKSIPQIQIQIPAVKFAKIVDFFQNFLLEKSLEIKIKGEATEWSISEATFIGNEDRLNIVAKLDCLRVEKSTIQSSIKLKNNGNATLLCIL
jgi:hypothetical protein